LGRAVLKKEKEVISMSGKKVVAEKIFKLCCDDNMKLISKDAKKEVEVYECPECGNKVEVSKK